MEFDKQISIKLSGKIAFEEHITLNQAAQIIGFISNTSGDSGQIMPAGATVLTPQASGRPLAASKTPLDALESTGAKTNAQRIVAFAGYLSDETQENSFTLEDIKPLFRRANLRAPGNINRDLDTAFNENWLTRSQTKGEFYLTNKGIKVLETGFVGEESAAKKPARKVRRTPISMPETFAGIDDIPRTMQDTIDFRHLQLGTDRLLWALHLAKNVLKIDGLDNKDIVWLTDHLGSAITANNINGTLNAAKNKNRARRSLSTQKIHITDDGEDYVRALTNEK